MQRRHLFVCTNERSGGKPACGERGGREILAAVQQRLIVRSDAASDALVTACGCLGPCFDGPNAVVYPDGVWYEQLEPSDADALVEHLCNGTVLQRKATSG
jgi:(2Fe-2S) ferredoxin